MTEIFNRMVRGTERMLERNKLLTMAMPALTVIFSGAAIVTGDAKMIGSAIGLAASMMVLPVLVDRQLSKNAKKYEKKNDRVTIDSDPPSNYFH